MNHNSIIDSVRRWVVQVVIELNLCPFAKRELSKNRIRFFVSEADNEPDLLAELSKELLYLSNNENIETTLLIHPNVLQDFFDYNQFLNDADLLLQSMDLEGVFQIASFHPDYQFSGTEPENAENYTNRSPFPMLHLLREDSLSKAIAEYPDADKIPERNIEKLRSLGIKKLKELFNG